MTREELTDKMKDLQNPPTRVNLIQQVYDIMNEENEQLKAQIEKMKCCGNCNKLDKEYKRCELKLLSMNNCLCKDKDKWELEE